MKRDPLQPMERNGTWQWLEWDGMHAATGMAWNWDGTKRHEEIRLEIIFDASGNLLKENYNMALKQTGSSAQKSTHSYNRCC